MTAVGILLLTLGIFASAMFKLHWMTDGWNDKRTNFWACVACLSLIVGSGLVYTGIVLFAWRWMP